MWVLAQAMFAWFKYEWIKWPYIFYTFFHFLSNYADDNSLYNTGKVLELVKSGKRLQSSNNGFMKILWYLNRKNVTIYSLKKNTESDIFKFENMC